MYKGKILIIVLVFLISLAGYYTYQQNRVLESSDFTIKNSEQITEIHFIQADDTLVLRKKNNLWLVNDAFPANRSLIKRFFKIFSNLNLLAPVSKSKQDSVVKILNKSALKILLYKNSSLEYEYLLGELNANKTGNYLMCDDNLGLLNSLGLYKNLKSIVSINSLFWRNKIVFNKQANEIKSIRFDNLQEIENSFQIKAEKNKIKLFDYKNNPIDNYDTAALKRYLSYFQNISFKEVENNLTDDQLNYILKNNKAYSIELIDQNNFHYSLNLYFKPQNPDKDFRSNKYDLNMIYGKLNNEKYLLIFDYYDIDPVLKDLSWFLQK